MNAYVVKHTTKILRIHSENPFFTWNKIMYTRCSLSQLDYPVIKLLEIYIKLDIYNKNTSKNNFIDIL